MAQRTLPEQSIGVSSEQLSALLDSAHEMLALLTPDGTVLSSNAASIRALGHGPEELIGRSLMEFLHPEDVKTAKSQFANLDAGPNGAPKERYRLRSKTGEWRWFEITLSNRGNGGSLDGYAASLLDVTELLRMEAERRVIADVVHALNQTANLDQLLDRIHQALKKVLSAENCFVALHNRQTDTFSFPFFADQFDTAPPPQKVGRSCTAYVFRTGRAMLIPQTEFDRLAAEGEVELVGSPCPAWLGVPLKTPTATIGVLVVQQYENEKTYDQRDLEFLDSVGGHIALAIERRRSEEALRESESMFRHLFSHNPLPTWVVDDESLRFIQVNEAAIWQYGYGVHEFSKMNMLDIQPESQRDAFARSLQESREKERYQGVWKHRNKEGRVFEVEVTSHQLDYGGRPAKLVVSQDIGDRHHLEQQLRQAQKMEAVGRLAGGIAHDFNNLLMVIKGHAELLLNTLPPGDRVSKKISQIDRAADRAATLTKQLLAFSRKQVIQPRLMNLNLVVEELGKLLPRLIGEDIELQIRCSHDLGTIRADASQIEQIIMNLVVNSRDAMPNGGRLVIETCNADLDRGYNSTHAIVHPGLYVLLAVSDTGIGMTAETQAHIFEPFFTTKEPGKGTGLGLATVYGVVKQSGGFIWVYSEVGKGTSFKIYLPRVDQPADKLNLHAPFSDAPRGTETILLAEDEQDVRDVAREFLESGGYTVIQAQNGDEALRLAASHSGRIDLLVTDMVMPGMPGQELAGRLQRQNPRLRVIYMSGYSERAAVETMQSAPSLRLLSKPFSRGSMLRTVREALGDGDNARP